LQAIRDAVGPDVRLMIDCHWRFPQAGLADLVRITREVDACWLEDPVPDLTPRVAGYLRDQTGALITGGEHLATWAQYEHYAANAGADVLIADVKFVGGIGPLHRIARLAAAHGMQFAPHNPSGPVSTAASAHVALANPNTRILEFPFGEVDWRLQFAPSETVMGANLTVSGPGLGVDLDFSALTA
jgi:galactonate dehydratase